MVKPQRFAEDPDTWLAHLLASRGEASAHLLQKGMALYAKEDAPLLAKGVSLANILLSMDLDTNTLLAALIYPAILGELIHLDHVAEQFGEPIYRLLRDVLQMQSLNYIQHSKTKSFQAEQMRKMLLAMVSDVQAVLIMLAEKIWELRVAKDKLPEEQKKLSSQIMEVYAPLANRLGVWRIKWELEDLSLRYLEPAVYSTIAKSLASRREEREQYKNRVIQILSDLLKKSQIKQAKVMGRVKHIYSIYSKMKRKEADFSEIYDISAFRVLVDSVSDCYHVLSVLQNEWHQIPEEFDDYISQPKPNGYRSIHTVMVGPEDNVIEVQIRTHEMHQESELGVASHWRYKEGIVDASHDEAKIALLRQVMEWQHEMAGVYEAFPKDIFADRVYVFTPMGEIIDLPQGATPLDFAYTIHSEIGHRTRGAKANNKMVPLTYCLQTGDRVEIMTAKEQNPSRDWLNPHFGFLKSPRARSKLQHYFRVKDHAVSEERHPDAEKILQKAKPLLPLKEFKKREEAEMHLAMDDLLTKIANCCKPLPGDAVVGYITQAQGISIHRKNCANVLHLKAHNERRFIDVNFSEKFVGAYPVEIQVTAFDRTGLLRDITGVIATENITLLGVRTHLVANNPEVAIHLTLRISKIEELNKMIHLIQQVPSVSGVRRM